jgi:hypothetical protein
MSPQWIVTAARLREVREACLDFLDRWAISRLGGDPLPLDRMASDVRQRSDCALAELPGREWRFLYRGGVFDDQ